MATKYLKLSEQDVLALKDAMKKKFRWDHEPHLFQVKAVRAQLEGIDVVIQAPMGAGKTAIAAGPHVWPTMKGRITIMISPLLALENEMVETFRIKYGLHAICVNSKNGGCIRAVQKQLLSGSIQVLLVSPEMLLSKIFTERLLRQTKFTQNIGSVVIDEAHCISHWGSDFHKKYGEIGTLCAFFSPKIPFVAMSATLTPRVRRDIFSILHFSKGEYQFVNVGNNRPNVSIVVRSCRHPLNSFQDLDFIFPQTITSLSDIPKTWIYVDNITEGEKMADYLSTLLKTRNPNLHDSHNAIRPYNARLPPEYRTAAMEAFRKGEIRVLICTEAAGMGCDIPDIDLVIQWRVPATLSHLVQRAGHVARGAGHIGMALLLVERSIYSEATPAPPPELKIPVDDIPAFRGLGRGEIEKNDLLEPQEGEGSVEINWDLNTDDHGLRAFIFSRTCQRKVWLSAFEANQCNSVTDPESELQNNNGFSVPCCDICAPKLFKIVRPLIRRCGAPKSSNTKMPTHGKPDIRAWNKLEDWRCQIYACDHRGAFYSSTAILDNKYIESPTSYSPLSPQQASHLLREKWPWWHRYENELLEFLLELPIEIFPIDVELKPTETVPSKSVSSGTQSAPAKATPTKAAPTRTPLKAKTPHKATSNSSPKVSIKTPHRPPKRVARPKLTVQQPESESDSGCQESEPSQGPIASGSLSASPRPNCPPPEALFSPPSLLPNHESTGVATCFPGPSTAAPTIHSQGLLYPGPGMFPPPYYSYPPNYYPYYPHHYPQPPPPHLHPHLPFPGTDSQHPPQTQPNPASYPSGPSDMSYPHTQPQLPVLIPMPNLHDPRMPQYSTPYQHVSSMYTRAETSGTQGTTDPSAKSMTPHTPQQ